MESRTSPRRRGRAARITDRDRALLEFAAEHRLVLAGQVGALLGISTDAASGRTRTLADAGYLEADRKLHGEPSYYQVTRQGLRAIGSDLPRPRRADLALYRHDVGIGWLMLAARAGVVGPWREIIGERRMRSHDPRADPGSDPFGIRMGGPGPGGGPRLHYPDLLMTTGSGHRVAFELELTSKSRRRREDILAAYAADARISVVVYLVDDPAVGRALRTSVQRLDISSLVRVQAVRWGDQCERRSSGQGAERTRRARIASPATAISERAL
jgi:hypothetical protein